METFLLCSEESQKGPCMGVVVVAGSVLAGWYVAPDLPSSGFGQNQPF